MPGSPPPTTLLEDVGASPSGPRPSPATLTSADAPSLAERTGSRRQLARARLARWLGRARSIPLWREARIFAEWAALVRDPIYAGHGVPRGDGRPVLLIPGYLASDRSLAVLGAWLHRLGYRTARAAVGWNTACADASMRALERRLDDHVERSGQRAVVLGHSRGGGFARMLAVRRPDLVAGLITLGTPMRDPFAVHPLLLANVGLLGALGSLGVPGLFSLACLRGQLCCARAWRELHAALPADLPFVSIYSRSDGIVDWRACIDPHARNVEIDASHIGMSMHAGVYREIVRALGG